MLKLNSIIYFYDKSNVMYLNYWQKETGAFVFLKMMYSFDVPAFKKDA